MEASSRQLGRPPRFSAVLEPCREYCWPWFKLSVFGELGLNNTGLLAATEDLTESYINIVLLENNI